jgi:hypothetical protein
MLDDLRKYTKFVGATSQSAANETSEHFRSVGLTTKVLSSPEAAELAKLTETTYFGLMIAWAQEVERYADRVGVGMRRSFRFYDEIGFFPRVKYFPGVIGGHCVMPNIELLKRLDCSEILESHPVLQREKGATRKRPKEEPLTAEPGCWPPLQSLDRKSLRDGQSKADSSQPFLFGIKLAVARPPNLHIKAFRLICLGG